MDRAEKAFGFVTDTSKQLITLATAILTFSITFSEKMEVESQDSSVERWLLVLTWLVYSASIFFGVWMQLGVASVIQPTEPTSGEPSIRESKIKDPFKRQIFAFSLGTLLALVFGLWRIAEPQKRVQSSDAPKIETTKPVPELPHFSFHYEVLFENNSSMLDPISASNFVSLTRTTLANRFTIEAYTDSTGSSEYNLALAKARADAVRAILIAEGVRSERISIVAYGNTHPLNRNQTVEERSRNRRAVVRAYAQ